MPTDNKSPNWFFFMNAHNFTGTVDSLEYSLADMVLYINSDQTLEHFKNLLTDYLYESAEFDPNAERKLAMVLEAKAVAADRLAEIDERAKAIAKEKHRAQDIVDALKYTALHATINGSFDGKVVNDKMLKVSTGPGRFVPKHDPDPSSPAYSEYQQFVKQKLSWDIMGMKSALAEGVIDKDFLDRHGIDVVRDVTLKES